MLKRIFYVILIVFTLTIVVSCGKVTYSGWEVYKEATCTEEAIYRNYASDGTYLEEKKPALGHELNYYNDVEATCYENGYDGFAKCIRCNYTQGTIIPAQHQYEKTIIEPICGVDGYTLYECTKCYHSYTDEFISVGEVHDYECSYEVIEDQNFKYPHVYGLAKCKTCGHEIKEEGIQTSIRVVLEATCTEEGTHERIFSFENSVFENQVVNSVIEPLKHNETKLKEVPATCEETGLTEGTYCSRCKEILKEQEIIPATGHKYAEPTYDWYPYSKKVIAVRTCQNNSSHKEKEETSIECIESVSPTCELDGYEIYVSGEFTNEVFSSQTYKYIVGKKGHSLSSSWTIDVAATATTTDLRSRHCSRCDYTTDVRIIPITQYSDGLKYTLNDKRNGYIVSGTDYSIKNLNITPEYDGLPVVGITDNAFKNIKNSLETIIIPDTVKTISANLFADCSKLKSITIPFIGETIESDNVTLASLFGVEKNSDLPNTLKTLIITKEDNLSAETLANCSNLTEISLPSTLNNIAQGALYGCSSLTKLTIPYVGASKSVNNAHKLPLGYIFGSKSFTDSTQTTQYYDYYNTSSKEYSISTIKYYIPNSLKEVGVIDRIYTGAFSNCKNLETIIFPKYAIIPAYSFYGLSLTSIEIPDRVVQIGDYAFASCSKLTSIVIPDSVKTIGENVLSNCSSIEKITLPFTGAKENPTKENRYPFGYIFGNVYGNINELKQNYQYYNSETNEYVSSTIKYRIPSSLKTVVVTKSISYGAFSNCSMIESITYPQYHTTPDYAFYNCSSLTKLSENTKVEVIGNYAFYGCKLLAKLNMSESLIKIGDYAYYDCDSIEIVQIPKKVQTIGNYAFASCNKLTSIVIPDRVTYIGENVLSNCSSIEKITLPFTGAKENPTKENIYPFGYIFGNVYGNINELKQNYQYYNSETDEYASSTIKYRIPSSLKTVIVTKSISYGAFSNCSMIESITYPESKNIPEYAFYNCKALTTINENAKATTIGNYAFYGCESLTTLPLNESLIYIGDYAFYDCKSVETIEVPNKVYEIGDYAFGSCSKLTSIVIPNSVYYIGEKILTYCGEITEITLPFIGDSRSSYHKNTYPLGYLFNTLYTNGCSYSIQYYQYYNSEKNETSISTIKYYIPTSLKSVVVTDVISVGAFSNCSMLESITYPQNSIIPAYAFYNCSALTTINENTNLTTIGEYAFYGCSKLEEIDLGKLNWIKEYAFTKSGIKTICLPETLTEIGKDAFSSCSNLVDVYYNGTIDTWRAIKFESNYSNPMYYASNLNIEDVPEVYVVDDTTSITLNEFKGIKGLKSLIIDSCVTSIEKGAFKGLEIESITLPFIGGSPTDNNKFVYIFEDIKYIPKTLKTVILNVNGNIKSEAFIGINTIENVILGENVLGIDSAAFKNCTILKNIEFNDGLEYIGQNAFYNCYSIKELNIPKSVTLIYNEAFTGCGGLEKIVTPFIGTSRTATLTYDMLGTWFRLNPQNFPWSDEDDFVNMVPIKQAGLYSWIGASTHTRIEVYMPANLKEIVVYDDNSIGYGAFSYCYMIESITLNDEITSIDKYAFAGCSGISEIKLPNGVSIIDSSALLECSNLETLILSAGMVEINKNYFAEFMNLTTIVISTGTEVLTEAAFAGLTTLTNVVIPNTIKVIEDFAFKNCVNLQSIQIPSSVIKIGNNIFDGCVNLIEVVIPSTVEIMGNVSLKGMEYLEKFVIESGVLEIGSIYIENCEKLTELIVSASTEVVTDIAIKSSSIIEKLELPEKATNISKIVIENCEKFTTIVWPKVESKVEELVISGCNLIKEYEIDEKLISFGKIIVENCSELTILSIKASISVSQIIVNKCQKITTVIIGEILEKIDELDLQFDAEMGDIEIIISKDVYLVGKFSISNAVKRILFEGTKEEWANLPTEWNISSNIDIYYYQTTTPTDDGLYWYYDTNGSIIKW